MSHGLCLVLNVYYSFNLHNTLEEYTIIMPISQMMILKLREVT